MRYIVFDAPAVAEPFEQRMEYLNELVRKHGPQYAVAHSQTRCQGIPHLKEELQRVEALGGEGLMLRQPASRSLWGTQRTTSLDPK